MANEASRYSVRPSSAAAAMGFSTSNIPPAHQCPGCQHGTLQLAGVLKAAEEGRLPAALRNAIPDTGDVARWLRPPDVPTNVASTKRDIWGPSFFNAITLVVIALTGVMLNAILGWMIAVPITILAMVVVYIRSRKDPHAKTMTNIEIHGATLAMRTWDRRMEVWERLGVCPNCGKLSDGVSGRIADWHSVHDLFV